MKAIRKLILVLCMAGSLWAQAQDSASSRLLKDTYAITIDTNRIRKHSPRIATRRSAILPGWGQAYNREYWKIPIVWGALGTAAGVWVYNNTWYQRTKLAYTIVVDQDRSRYGEINSRLKYNDSTPLNAQSLQFYRNEFRRSRDYSLLYFLGIWALNVVDATVFAHLKEFDVSDDLSIRITPGLDPVQRTAGLHLSMGKKTPSPRKLLIDSR